MFTISFLSVIVTLYIIALNTENIVTAPTPKRPQKAHRYLRPHSLYHLVRRTSPPFSHEYDASHFSPCSRGLY